MALVRVYKQPDSQETGRAHGDQEIKGKGRVIRAGGVDDAARDDGTDKRGGGAEEIEEGIEEELFAAWRHLGDLCSVRGMR